MIILVAVSNLFLHTIPFRRALAASAKLAEACSEPSDCKGRYSYPQPKGVNFIPIFTLLERCKKSVNLNLHRIIVERIQLASRSSTKFQDGACQPWLVGEGLRTEPRQRRGQRRRPWRRLHWRHHLPRLPSLLSRRQRNRQAVCPRHISHRGLVF